MLKAVLVQDTCLRIPFPAHSYKAMASTSEAGRRGGTVPDKPEYETKMCHGAQKLLKHSKGRMRIKLEDCGPAIFNRFGQPLSGKHQCTNPGE